VSYIAKRLQGAPIERYLQPWLAEQPDFFWCPTSGAALLEDRVRGKRGAALNGAQVGPGGVISPASSTTIGKHLYFNTNVGVAASTPHVVTMLVSASTESTYGTLFKLGFAGGYGIGHGENSGEDAGTRILLLQEGVSWTRSGQNAWANGLNVVSCGYTNQGVLFATNHTIGTEAAIQSASPTISEHLYINGRNESIGSSFKVHALAIFKKSLANEESGVFRAKLRDRFRDLEGKPTGFIDSLFVPKRRTLFPVSTPASTTSTFFIKRPWKAQPQNTVLPANLRGLRYFWNFGDKSGRCLITGTRFTLDSAYCSYKGDGTLEVLATAASGNVAYALIPIPLEKITMVIGYKRVFGTVSWALMDTLWNGWYDGSADWSTFQTASVDFSGSVTPTAGASSNGPVKVVAFSGATNDLRTSLDGGPIATDSATTGPSLNPASFIYITLGADRDGGNRANVNVQFIALFDRNSSDQELRALSALPWANLVQPRRTPASFSSAASSLPTLSLATYVPGSITTTGFRPRVTAS
jgi:hypothetical protein